MLTLNQRHVGSIPTSVALKKKEIIEKLREERASLVRKKRRLLFHKDISQIENRIKEIDDLIKYWEK